MLINSVRNTVKNNTALICHQLYPHLAFWARSRHLPDTKPLILFILLLIIPLGNLQASNCTNTSFNDRAVVTRVYDGDTVKLKNGKHIRLIGINTPEMNYDTGTPEPYAKKAKRFLEKRVLNKKIGIKYGRDKKDRYKRVLAHIFLLDGTNLQYQLLKAGLAFNISIPPNLWQHECYKKAENQAKLQKKGIWNSPYYQAVDANKINKHHTGFKQIKGIVRNVLTTKKSVLIILSDKMALRIHKKDLHYFKHFKPKRLIGKRITAKGWVRQYKKSFNMRIRHPDAMSTSRI